MGTELPETCSRAQKIEHSDILQDTTDRGIINNPLPPQLQKLARCENGQQDVLETRPPSTLIREFKLKLAMQVYQALMQRYLAVMKKRIDNR